MSGNIVLALVIGGQLTTMGSYNDMTDCSIEAKSWREQGVVAVCHTTRPSAEYYKEAEQQMERVQQLAAKFMANMEKMQK